MTLLGVHINAMRLFPMRCAPIRAFKNRFLPDASIGLRVLSLPASVRPSVSPSACHQVCPRDNSSPVQVRATKFGPKVLNTLVKIPVVWGLIEHDMSNLTYFQNPVYLHHFGVFEIFVRPAKTDETESVPHPKWLRTYMFAHRNVSWTVEQSGCIFSVTIAGFPVLDSAIGNGFLHASVGFRQIIHTSHAEILYANIR